MKKKKYLLIPILAILIAAGATLGFMKAKSITLEMGYIIKADNGSYLYVNEKGGPNRMTDMSRSQKMFEKLRTGDKALIAHDGVNESYPGSTAAYLCIKLKSGDESNVSDSVMSQLESLGWIASEEKISIDEPMTAVELSKNGNSMCIDIPTDWTIERGKTLYGDTDESSITVTPKGSKGSVTLTCYPDSGFAVCGTGLHTESILDGKGTIGFYDSEPLWSFILIKKGEAQFVATQIQLSVEEAAKVRSIVENGVYKVKSDERRELTAENMNVKYTKVRWRDTEGEEAFFGFAMKNDYGAANSKKAVPTVMIKSKKALDDFLEAMDGIFWFLKKMSMEAYKESFMAVADNLGEEFFEQNVLLITYVWEGSGSVTHSVEKIWVNGDKIEFQIKRNEPEIGTCDMAAWFISMELPKQYAKDITGINSWM